MSEIATREQILSLAGLEKRRFMDVDLPVSGLRVRIRSLTEEEYARYQMAVVNTAGKVRTNKLEDAGRRLIALCIVDENGNRLFADNEADKLRSLDNADAQSLYNACLKHNGINRDEEEMLKNLGIMPGGGLPTELQGE